jgi:hypothetical protein
VALTPRTVDDGARFTHGGTNRGAVVSTIGVQGLSSLGRMRWGFDTRRRSVFGARLGQRRKVEAWPRELTTSIHGAAVSEWEKKACE